MQFYARLLAIVVPLALVTDARAAVTISLGATQNMSCSNGDCTPTAKDAIFNVTDLENLLASGNVTVTTTGSGVQADDIHVSSALSWASSSTLSMEAHRSVAIKAAVSIMGLGGLTLDTRNHGALWFGKGDVSFANLSSQLTINGHAYALVGDIKTLASAIARNPSGAFALAGSYDASADGAYGRPPITTIFAGKFEGLGNNFSNLTIKDSSDVDVGFFAEIGAGGIVSDLSLKNAQVTNTDTAYYTAVGALAGLNDGSIWNSHATGAVTGTIPDPYSNMVVGGLVGENGASFSQEGTIVNSYAVVVVTGGGIGGGLVGQDFGPIRRSFASGSVSKTNSIGGLVGTSFGPVENSYATGSVSTTDGFAGGLLGGNAESATVSESYSTGKVHDPYFPDARNPVDAAIRPPRSHLKGGLIGNDGDLGINVNYAYWDVDTSGVKNLSQGAGYPENDPGIAGQTTAQFRSGSPAGFDPSIWGEKAKINGGLPYLIANPPPK